MSNGSPPRIYVLAKPTGAVCNLACAFCFFLDKELLYFIPVVERIDEEGYTILHRMEKPA
jgi:sulfatase maturation enzyme AslB (radical SAM superfamily)